MGELTTVVVWPKKPTADELLQRRLHDAWRPTETRLQAGPRILGHAACCVSPTGG